MLYVDVCIFTKLVAIQHSGVSRRTNGRVYTTVSVCLSSVCNVCIVAKRCVLLEKTLKKQIGNGLWGIEWSRDR